MHQDIDLRKSNANSGPERPKPIPLAPGCSPHPMVLKEDSSPFKPHLACLHGERFTKKWQGLELQAIRTPSASA